MKKLLDQYLTLVKNFIPETKDTRPSLGLDIGTYSCKAVEIIPSDNEAFTLLNWAIEPVKNNNPAEAVKKILEKMNTQTKDVSTSVGGQGTLIRYIDMPKMPLKDAKQSFAIEADKYFPFPKDQIYTDCFIVDQDSVQNKMSLLAAAAKKDIIDHRMQLLAGLGLETSFIGLNSLTIANIFNVVKQKQAADAPAEAGEAAKLNAFAILDIGETTTSLIILKDNLPKFTRDIFIGGKDFNKRISNVLSVNLEEADRIKHDPHDKLENILSSCDSILSNLASEVRLSFDYFVTEYNTPITRLFLIGGSSLLEGVPEFFAKNLEIASQRWNPVSAFKVSPSVESPELNKNAGCLGVALGLALYQL